VEGAKKAGYSQLLVLRDFQKNNSPKTMKEKT
jgi:hypothetical protein